MFPAIKFYADCLYSVFLLVTAACQTVQDVLKKETALVMTLTQPSFSA